MSADTAPDITTETTALIRALLQDGWTYANPVRTERQWRSRIHELASPDGLLYLDAAVFPDGHMTARLSAEAVRTEPAPVPGWMVDLHEVPLTVALAAVKAAAAPGRPPHAAAVALGAALAGHGWTQWPDITERNRLLRRKWESPDGERFVRWNPADSFDEGGWTISRPGPGGDDADTEISQHTPASVITALALTDDPGEQPGPGEPRLAPTVRAR